MKRMSMLAFGLLATLSFPLAFSAQAQSILTKIDRLEPRELQVGGFELSRKQSVTVEAVGFRERSERYDVELTTAWILDADTREVVWHLEDADSERRARHLREYQDKFELDAGRYEVYYSTYPNIGGWGWDRESWWNFVDGFKGGGNFDWDDYEDAAKDFEIIVHGDGKSLSRSDVESYHENLSKGAVLSWTRLEGKVYQKTGLQLDGKTELEIYAIGELRKDELFDGPWIVNAETREKVWSLDYWESDDAGGADKNRMFKGKITLPAGKYIVYCATDDSHNFNAWNTAPPLDPFYWGVTIQVAGGKSQARTYEYEDMPEKNVVVSLTGLGKEDFKTQGFALARATKLRVYAIGEGRGRDMYDSARIVDATTREVVWEMDARDTEHAGGASKNRVFDGVVEFKAGNYLAYAYSDGSHSYNNWNASPPHDQEHWGLTISVANGSMKGVSEYKEEEDESTLVRLVEMGNNERERGRFNLDRDSRVIIYAIGEGTRNDMADYAWIEDAKGRVVWEMTYRMTEHAGGAKKNRMYRDDVKLDAGEYTVFYKSDGSHSFNRWNARPPSDFLNWGVTIKIANGR
jgi:hypothetical protein